MAAKERILIDAPRNGWNITVAQLIRHDWLLHSVPNVVCNPCIRMQDDRMADVNIVLQFTAEEEAKALPILLRHSPGTILSNRTYIVDASAAQALRDANVSYR